VDWLLGREGAEKDSPRVSLIKNQLHDYLRLREATLRGTTPGNRVRVAIDFLILQDPELFTVERVARQLVISSETLAQMLDDQVMTTPLVVQRFAQYTNLPEIWFYQPVPQLEDPFVKYRTLVERFQAEGLSPDDVEQRLWGSRRTSRRTKRAEHE
jgi:hypothetical protein